MSTEPAAPSRAIQFAAVEGAADLFTPEFVRLLTHLNQKFTPVIHELRRRRVEVLKRAHDGDQPRQFPLSAAAAGDWHVPTPPKDLTRPGIEISGPASVTGMFINALNPGPEGIRAEGDLDDDEDSAGHRFEDTVRAAWNRKKAIERTLTYRDEKKGKTYRIAEGELPFFMHRERGIHLDEPDVTIAGQPIPASILGAALTLFHSGRAHVDRGQGIYFYLPKLEAAEEARFWRDFFQTAQEQVPHLKNAVIRAILLVESLPAAYQMEEMLFALGPYAAGLNAARWDFKASVLEFVMNDSASVWPDRFGVDIKTTDFLANVFRRLVAVCLKRGGVPIGGMATALPSKDDEVNKAAAAAIRADKEWEAHQGFLRGWVAHIFHMKTAGDPFRQLRGSGWKPSADMADPDRYPVRIAVPSGPITIAGTRRNARMLVEYLEGWLNGRGAKSIDSLAGKPGIHPALMEDLATARISVAQIAQRVRHHVRCTDSADVHDFPLAKKLLREETNDILSRLRSMPEDEENAGAEERYQKACKIALQWVQNYVKLDFRSLGSYKRRQLDEIASQPDAF